MWRGAASAGGRAEGGRGRARTSGANFAFISAICSAFSSSSIGRVFASRSLRWSSYAAFTLATSSGSSSFSDHIAQSTSAAAAAGV